MTRITRQRITARRSRKPRAIAVVDESCTGCAGSPVCQMYCPVEECMVERPNPSAPAFRVIEVDPLRCIGCRLCVARGPQGTLLEGCPWDAIRLVPLREYEASRGELEY